MTTSSKNIGINCTSLPPFIFTRKVGKVILKLLKEIKRSPDHKMVKLLTFANLIPAKKQFAQTRSRTTTAIAFSRQNDAGSLAHAT